jgi:protein gp37
MSDLFHPGVPDEYILEIAAVMEMAKWHTFQVLTKRAARMRDLLNSKLQSVAQCGHIWWGVSVENREYGMPRLEDLRAANARVRFLSVEPLLEDLGVMDLSGIHWVIVGGESGPGARPMCREWVTSVRDQCSKARVPFFFKQWGGVQKSKTGRDLDGITYNDYPEPANSRIPHRRQRMALAAKVQCSFGT